MDEIVDSMDERTKNEYIARAEALGDACLDYILGEIRPGVTENGIAAKIEAYLLANGGEALAFPTICVSGPRGCLMHGEPSDRAVEKGELLTMDFGAVVGGYCGDMTRTVAVGAAPGAEEARCYELVLESKKRGIDALAAGVSCRAVDSAARELINKAGYGGNFVHGTGHGVGREVHTPPYLNRRTDETLSAGDAVTVEPGIYVQGRFGVRIEDLLIVGDTDIINLTKSPDSLIII
ncbi:MAG: M24 family metallopeptidase [Clostridiales Family XIII bacterium]|jgi:Xaa-Pro aminopeptidase|nr:M24 family metallopeptidase [Clostridiales Family XIII bacterium]